MPKLTTVTLPTPLNIRVSHIAACFPKCGYHKINNSYIFFDPDTPEAIYRDDPTTSTPKVVLRFSNKTAHGFNTVSTEYSAEGLELLLAKSPKLLADLLRQVLINTELVIPEISQFEFKVYSEITPTHAKGVSQGEFTITNENEQKYIIGATGTSFDTIIAIYNSKLHTAAIANVSSDAKPVCIKYLLFSMLQYEEYDSLKIYISSGYKTNKSKDIIELIIKEHPLVQLYYCSLMHGNSIYRSLAINSITGAIYTDFEETRLDLTGLDPDRKPMTLASFNSGVDLRDPNPAPTLRPCPF